MKDWPLRLKIALWSSVVVGLTVVVSGLATGQHFYQEDLAMLDHLLARESRGVFDELERLPTDFDFGRGKLDRLLPAAYKHREIQIRRLGTVVYQSGKTDRGAYGADEQPVGNYSLGLGGKLRLAVVEKGPWQVRVASETDRARDSVAELMRGFLIASPALLLITGLGSWWIARKALAPIQAVTEAAEEITAEHLDQRLPVPPSRDEVQRLSIVLNRMIERLERSFYQARRFSADTSHELRTPLAVIHAGLEAMLSSREASPHQEQQLLDLLDATTRLSALSEKLLLLSRADAGYLPLDRAPLDLAAMLRESIEEASIFAEPSGIEMRSDLLPRLELNGDAATLMQVWRNLLENAVKYNRPDGRVAIHLRAENGSAQVAITNTGPGLDAAQAAQLFTRFYRAEPHRGTPGYGLGLSISREIVRAHGGELTLESHAAEGITFLVTLPKT